MNLKFNNKKITGILTILPEKEIKFEDEIDNYSFSRSQSMKLKLVMGYDRRRVVQEGTTVSDLCIYGMKYLFEQEYLNKHEIDALILVTQSPDHFMPATSQIIHGALDLKQDIFCLDISQGCSGYPIGLIQALQLLDQEEIKKVVVLNADILSSKVSEKDRSSRPLTGDAASITIVENSDLEESIYGSVKFDGKGADSLIIPAGGFRLPSTAKTSELKEDDAGNIRSLDHMLMKGDMVFNFVQTEVPPMIFNLLNKAKIEKEEIDYYIFHQPNKFMLKKLANKMGIHESKLPNNIVENFGNAGSVSIPTTITHNLGDALINQTLLICLAGFGAGLSWSSLLLRIGKLNFCETINFK